MTDNQQPSYWRDILPGSTITLTDAQSLEESIDGLDFVVDEVRSIRQENNLAEWIFLSIDDPEQEIYLVVKIVGNDVELFVYYQPEEFEPGNRRDIIERGDEWIFTEPADMDNFKYNELDYVDLIEWSAEDEEGEAIDLLYKMKSQRVQFGECHSNPADPAFTNVFASVAEYHADTDFENPELMLVEIGGAGEEEGGLLTMLAGCTINTAEVDVLKASTESDVKPLKRSFWEKAVRRVSKL